MVTFTLLNLIGLNVNQPNPYQKSGATSRAKPIVQIQKPANALIAVSILAIVVGLAGLAFEIYLFATFDDMDRVHLATKWRQPKQIWIRVALELIPMIAACFIIYAAQQMKSLRNWGLCRTAAIIACIPLIGPCLILGIPCGMWALSVMGQTQVKVSFR